MKGGKLLQAIAALLCAVCLWIYVVTVVAPEDDMTISGIPITFVGESELRSNYELILSNPTPSTVSVKFHGSRSDLKQLVNNRSGITAAVDVTKCTTARDYAVSYEISLPSAIQDKAISISDRSPKTVRFTVKKLTTESVMVRGVFSGSPAEGYVVGEMTFDQDSVLVTGPEETVEQIDYAQVVLYGSNVKNSVSARTPFTLIGKDGSVLRSEELTIDTDTIGATVPVYLTKEVPLRLNVIPGSGATEKNAELTISPKTVTVYGSEAALRSLNEIVIGEIDLGSVLTDRILTFEVRVPAGVHMMTEHKNVAVSVKIVGITSETYRAEAFTAEGLAADLAAEIKARSISVVLRGQTEKLSSFSAQDLTLQLDLSEHTQPGTYELPVTVLGAPDGVAVMGKYSVSVVLMPYSEPEPEPEPEPSEPGTEEETNLD